jgi:hypothetical protein
MPFEMTPVPPAEWLLDIFTSPGYQSPYMMSIELPNNYATWYANGALACVVALVILTVLRFL